MTQSKITTRPIRGFEHVNRYWDPHMKISAAKILPGECYVSKTGEMIVTVLGSCIAACIRDCEIGVGGMNHFMLPMQNPSSPGSAIVSELAYGNWAMEFLVNEVIKQGGRKSNMEVKLFGGGNVMSSFSHIDVGGRNIEFALSFLEKEGLKIVANDLGSDCPRKVLYFPDTGAVKLRRLKIQKNDTIEKREREYFESVNKETGKSDIELF